MAIDPYAGCNPRILPEDCTLDTCCLAQSHYTYLPSYGGNLFFAIFFGIFIIPQLGLGIYYKTWGYGFAMVAGLVLELLGYWARIEMHNDPFASNPFLIYLICNTIAPVFFSAAIYLCISRVIILYNSKLARIPPKFIAIAFMVMDFICLVLQAAGGATVDKAETTEAKNRGRRILIAGLLLQVISLTVFLVVFADFTWRCHRKKDLDRNPEKQRIRQTLRFKLFRASLILATVLILIRSIFRVAELWEGLSGTLWNSEVDFMVLDGGMVALAVVCLTAFHPGPSFGGVWKNVAWHFRSRSEGKEIPLDARGLNSQATS